MGGIEIEIRRSNKIIPIRSKSVTHRIGDHERKTAADEKLKSSQSHWDYSTLHGKNIFFHSSNSILEENL